MYEYTQVRAILKKYVVQQNKNMTLNWAKGQIKQRFSAKVFNLMRSSAGFLLINILCNRKIIKLINKIHKQRANVANMWLVEHCIIWSTYREAASAAMSTFCWQTALPTVYRYPKWITTTLESTRKDPGKKTVSQRKHDNIKQPRAHSLVDSCRHYYCYLKTSLQSSHSDSVM